ncbi:hypothetical protein HUJ04_009541 [Dendroctonus ponderosae]|nr:hypothetical protein HUJ04_009541 [Dendroctonus ponderosae]
MDKQARKLNNSKGEGGAAEEGEEHGSNEDSDHDEKALMFKKRYLLRGFLTEMDVSSGHKS